WLRRESRLSLRKRRPISSEKEVNRKQHKYACPVSAIPPVDSSRARII
ncbi:MAG: hypothetical protein ACD_75C01167G0001, partial [uncultured bacterium]